MITLTFSECAAISYLAGHLQDLPEDDWELLAAGITSKDGRRLVKLLRKDKAEGKTYRPAFGQK